MFIRLFLFFLCGITLTACGGGSGEGTSSSSPNQNSSTYEIEISPTTITHTAAQSGQVEIFWITGTLTGEVDVPTMYVIAETDPEVFRSVTYYQEGASVTAQVETRGDLWSGTYTGTIIANVCSDRNCNSHLADSPYTIPYTIVIPKTDTRIEPVDYDVNTVIDFDRDFIAIDAESGTPGETIRFRTQIVDSLGELVLPDEMKEKFQISDITNDGFTLNTPTLPNGIYSFEYDFSYTDAPNSGTYTIYYMVGREGGSKDSFIFFEDPIVIEALYGQQGTGGSSRFLITGEERDILDYKEFEITYHDGDGWIESTNNWENFVSLYTDHKDLSVGDYTATLTGSTYYSQIYGSTEVRLEVRDGFILSNILGTVTFDGTNREAIDYITVANTRNAEGTWTVASDSLWIVLERTEGTFPDSVVNYSFDLVELAELPNGYSGASIFRFSSDDPRFPDSEFKIQIRKQFPEIQSLSNAVVNAGEAFELVAEGIHFYNALNVGVRLRNAENGDMTEADFSVEITSDNTLTLTHQGVSMPGVYEMVFDHDVSRAADYQLPFISSPTLEVLE